MTDDRKYFHDLMTDFGRASGIVSEHVEGTDDWIVPIEGGIVKLNVSYRAATGLVIVSSMVSPLAPSVDPAGRARALLEMNWQWKESRGFTIAIDDAANALIVVDRRAARRFANPGELGAYFEQACEVVRELRLGRADFEMLSRCMAEQEAAGNTEGEEG